MLYNWCFAIVATLYHHNLSLLFGCFLHDIAPASSKLSLKPVDFFLFLFHTTLKFFLIFIHSILFQLKIVLYNVFSFFHPIWSILNESSTSFLALEIATIPFFLALAIVSSVSFFVLVIPSSPFFLAITFASFPSFLVLAIASCTSLFVLVIDTSASFLVLAIALSPSCFALVMAFFALLVLLYVPFKLLLFQDLVGLLFCLDHCIILFLVLFTWWVLLVLPLGFEDVLSFVSCFPFFKPYILSFSLPPFWDHAY